MRRAEAEKENFMRENTEKSSALAPRRGRAPELLIPASSLEVLKTAVAFGADAVYIGGEAYGLRAKAKNFSMEDMREGIAFAHAHGVRVHVTANILAHDRDLAGIREYFQELKGLGPDALIIADPGVFMLAKEICPEIERHISTQANKSRGRSGSSRPGSFPWRRSGKSGRRSRRIWRSRPSSTAPCASPIPAAAF